MTGETKSGYLVPRPLAELTDALRQLSVPWDASCQMDRCSHSAPANRAYRAFMRNEIPLTAPLSESSLARAYVNGDLDVDGDVMSLLALRDMLRFEIPVSQLLHLGRQLFVPAATRTRSPSSIITPWATTST